MCTGSIVVCKKCHFHLEFLTNKQAKLSEMELLQIKSVYSILTSFTIKSGISLKDG